MPNRGTLNWSASNTTKSVSAGYYSGGTLDSRPSYTAGYNAGVSTNKNWRLVLKITFGAGSNGGGLIYTDDSKATNDPNGWYSTLQTTITCIDNNITITGKCAVAPRFGNQQNINGYISNIELVSFDFI